MIMVSPDHVDLAESQPQRINALIEPAWHLLNNELILS